jgi:hypothetical protein
MRLFKAILIFYKKIIIPALLMSIIIGFSGKFISETLSGSTDESSNLFSFDIAAGAFIIFSLTFHYFIYEVRNSDEYYFYFNLGLNKQVLWISTLLLSSIIAILSIQI